MELGNVAHGYDGIAQAYDQQVAADQAVRDLLWRRMDRLFRPGATVLDLACGTGIDTLHLAQHGVRVVAVDISHGMLARLEEKLADCPTIGQLVELRWMEIGTIGAWPATTFDGIISSFAGLNTVDELGQFGTDAARLLRPRGRMLIHLLSAASWRDRLRLALRGNWRNAAELRRRRVRRVRIGDMDVWHNLYEPHEVYRRYFKPHFALTYCCGTGVFVPEHAARLPKHVVSGLQGAERLFACHPPFVGWGRHYMLELTRRPQMSDGAPAENGRVDPCDQHDSSF